MYICLVQRLLYNLQTGYFLVVAQPEHPLHFSLIYTLFTYLAEHDYYIALCAFNQNLSAAMINVLPVCPAQLLRLPLRQRHWPCSGLGANIHNSMFKPQFMFVFSIYILCYFFLRFWLSLVTAASFAFWRLLLFILKLVAAATAGCSSLPGVNLKNAFAFS